MNPNGLGQTPAFEKFCAASDLPDKWDQLVNSYFQRRQFLAYAETYNPCNQRYYTLARQGELRAVACVYTLKLDIFTFTAIKSPVTTSVVGIPASVACVGIAGERW